MYVNYLIYHIAIFTFNMYIVLGLHLSPLHSMLIMPPVKLNVINVSLDLLHQGAIHILLALVPLMLAPPLMLVPLIVLL